jgi:hypothetical protein
MQRSQSLRSGKNSADDVSDESYAVIPPSSSPTINPQLAPTVVDVDIVTPGGSQTHISTTSSKVTVSTGRGTITVSTSSDALSTRQPLLGIAAPSYGASSNSILSSLHSGPSTSSVMSSLVSDEKDERKPLLSESKNSQCSTLPKNATILAGAVASGLTSAANAGLAWFLIYGLVANSKIFGVKDIVERGFDDIPPEILDPALVMAGCSGVVNILTGVDFLPKVIDILKDFVLFAKNICRCGLKPTLKTCLNVLAIVASGGAAGVMGLISKSTFEDVDSTPLTVLTVGLGSLLMLASRYDGGRSLSDTNKWVFKEEDWAFINLLDGLTKATHSLEKRFTTSDTLSSSTSESRIILHPEANHDENIKNLLTEIYALFAQYKLPAPLDLPDILKQAYNEGLLSLSEKRVEAKASSCGDQFKSFWHAVYIVVNALAGFAAYTLKFASQIANTTSSPDQPRNHTAYFTDHSANQTAHKVISYETTEDIIKVTSGLFVGAIACSTTGMLYGLSAAKVAGMLKELATYNCAGAVLAAVSLPINLLACPSMFTVAYKVGIHFQLSKDLALGFGILNAIGAWNINTRSCARISLALLKLKNPKLTDTQRASAERRIAMGFSEVLQETYAQARQKIEDLKKCFLDQRKPDDSKATTEIYTNLKNNPLLFGSSLSSSSRQIEGASASSATTLLTR